MTTQADTATRCLSSALPQDHPPGHQALQPAAGRRRPRQDRRLRREQGVRGDGRPAVVHGGDAGFHGPRDDDGARAELRREGETVQVEWGLSKSSRER